MQETKESLTGVWINTISLVMTMTGFLTFEYRVCDI